MILPNRVAQTGRIYLVHTEPLISKAAWDQLQKQKEKRNPVFHPGMEYGNVAAGVLIRYWKRQSRSVRMVLCV